jgi:RNA polymerase sigma-70 factor (ECF subfamily)
MSAEPDLETRIRAACTVGDYSRAATLVIEGYGMELMAFLISRARNPADAEEVFAMFAEKLWAGLPGFEWRCTVRAWAYRIARHAASDHATAAANRPQRNLALSQHAPLSRMAAQARTTTAAFRRTSTKDRVRALRDRLEPDDQLLLVLRVDRGMEFREIAAVLADGDAQDAAGAPAGAVVDAAAAAPVDNLTDSTLDREAARLRKRFERVKERLRELAEAEGLI